MVNLSRDTGDAAVATAPPSASTAPLAGHQKRSSRLRRRRARTQLALSAGSLVGAVALWQGIVEVLDLQDTLLPAPSAVLTALVDYAREGTMWTDSIATLRVVLLGLVIGLAIGVTLGLLMGWDRRIRALFAPLVAVTFPIPKIAFISLLVIWFGIGDTSRVVLTVIGVFYIILINTVAAVDGIPSVVVMAARNLGASRIQILRKVLLPAALPNIMASMRIAFSISLILVIAAEMQMPSEGVGSFIYQSGQILDTRSAFAGLILAGVFGLIGNYLIDGIERLVMPWRRVGRP